jgi:hypothetical protein
MSITNMIDMAVCVYILILTGVNMIKVFRLVKNIIK